MTDTGTPSLQVGVSRSGSSVVVSLAGELDLATRDTLRRLLAPVVDGAPAPERVVLDLARLEFVDAAGITALLDAQRALAGRGGELVLRSPSRLVRRVVQVLELEQRLPLETD